MLQAAIFQCEKNKKEAQNLVALAKKHGYDIHVFEDEAGQSSYGYPQVTCFAFYHVAERMQNTPFLWLEPDCSPLNPEWLKLIDEEYSEVPPGRIMLPQRNGEAKDVASGIGVYPARMIKLLPNLNAFKDTWYAFDYWVEQNLSHLIHRTNLIQHSYQDYSLREDVRRHRFPRDNYILSKKAVLFHSDKFQDLFPKE